MSRSRVSRRGFLGGALSGVLAGSLLTNPSSASVASLGSFEYCLNMATLMGHNLSILEEIDIAARAGYTSIEPWIRKINQYTDGGGQLADIKAHLEEKGLTVESAIGFVAWVVDDGVERQKGLDQAKRDMEILRAIGGKRMAAPPVGANREPGLDLFKAAQRYRILLQTAEEFEVQPLLEVWGPSANIHRLGEAVLVAVEASHPNAALLLDVYHIYKGGSDFGGLALLAPNATPVFHMNDYPAVPPRESISDRDRVYPGDGIAPTTDILRMLSASGSRTVLSLELFNQEYYRQDPLKVAETGLAKMKAAVRQAFA
jgi:sugar phosphate isomerase/epimerase